MTDSDMANSYLPLFTHTRLPFSLVNIILPVVKQIKITSFISDIYIIIKPIISSSSKVLTIWCTVSREVLTLLADLVKAYYSLHSVRKCILLTFWLRVRVSFEAVCFCCFSELF